MPPLVVPNCRTRLGDLYIKELLVLLDALVGCSDADDVDVRIRLHDEIAHELSGR